MKDYKKQKIDEKINFFMARNKNSKSSELIDWHERFGMARINFLAFFCVETHYLHIPQFYCQDIAATRHRNKQTNNSPIINLTKLLK